MRRVVLVLADGLRPDAITPGVMPSLDALGGVFTLALHARTVRPSKTVAALASLATGVAPQTHRLTEPGLGRRLTARGSRARETAATANCLLARREERLLFVYLPDCDRAGHAHGWMSQRYLAAAAEVDAGVGALVSGSDDTVFIITADHGGGGVTGTEHDQPHPANDHIPLIVAGPGVTRRHQLTRPISILDVPATILWWFGVPVPQRYEGRPVVEAFSRVSAPVTVPA